jgi:signal transduction histidine kinase/ActR/RegA family two-component response regulator
MTSLRKRLQAALHGPPVEAPPSVQSLAYWRERILNALYTVGALLGLVAYLPSVYLAVKENLWSVAVIDTLVYVWLIIGWRGRRLPFGLRAGAILGIIYTLGAFLLVRLGPFGAGPVWLFAFPIMGGVMFGTRGGYLSLGLSAATLAGMGFLLAGGHLTGMPEAANMQAKWWVISANFFLLNAMAVLSLSVLVQGLKQALDDQRAATGALASKHDELQQASNALQQALEERRQAESDLRHSNERFATVLDSIDADIHVSELEGGTILFMNRHMRDHLGGDFTGRRREDIPQVFNQPLTDGNPHRLVDAAGQPTGVHVWEASHAASGRHYFNFDRAIHWSDGRLVRLGIAMDVTERENARRERLALEGQLRQAQKMEALGTLAGGIAHDFNNILSAIIGFCEIAMQDAKGQPQLILNLEEVLKAGFRARDLTRQILTFSRQAEMEHKPVRVRNVAREALKLLRSSLPTTIEIAAELDSDASVLADPTQIHQVVMNLCTNAAHAMQARGGRLKVHLQDVSAEEAFSGSPPPAGGQHWLQLRVRDTGHGMDPAVQARIFEPYFTTKEKGKGTGMGLSVVHGIVEACRGEIRVASAPGEGAVFDVFLPVVESRPVGEEVWSAPPLEGRGERILLVDDDPQVARVTELMLRALGYQVRVFTDSLAALEAFQEAPEAVDLLMTDMTMPELTGADMAREALALRGELPVILCTGFNEQIGEDSAMALGIRKFLYKPVRHNELALAVREALSGAAPQAEGRQKAT